MKRRQEHNEPGHLNTLVRDHDSVVTGFGQHDRVVAFLPQGASLYIRVDHKWQLGEPTVSQVLEAARKNQGISGRWSLVSTEGWVDGSSTDYLFEKVGA